METVAATDGFRTVLYLDSYSNVNDCGISVLNWLCSFSDRSGFQTWLYYLLSLSLWTYKVLEIKVLNFFELQFSSSVK